MITLSQKSRTVKFFKRIRMVAARLTNLSVIDLGTLRITCVKLSYESENMLKVASDKLYTQQSIFSWNYIQQKYR